MKLSESLPNEGAIPRLNHDFGKPALYTPDVQNAGVYSFWNGKNGMNPQVTPTAREKLKIQSGTNLTDVNATIPSRSLLLRVFHGFSAKIPGYECYRWITEELPLEAAEAPYTPLF